MNTRLEMGVPVWIFMILMIFPIGIQVMGKPEIMAKTLRFVIQIMRIINLLQMEEEVVAVEKIQEQRVDLVAVVDISVILIVLLLMENIYWKTLD